MLTSRHCFSCPCNRPKRILDRNACCALPHRCMETLQDPRFAAHIAIARFGRASSIHIMRHDFHPDDPDANDPQAREDWTPELPTCTTYAWVTARTREGVYEIRERPSSPTRIAKLAMSCPVRPRRGDLVWVATDGYFHYIVAVLHQRQYPALALVDPKRARISNE